MPTEYPCEECNAVGPPLVTCATCGRMKQPWGRSAPIGMAAAMCNHECLGYYAEPKASSLWPGERYGDAFPCADWHSGAKRSEGK